MLLTQQQLAAVEFTFPSMFALRQAFVVILGLVKIAESKGAWATEDTVRESPDREQSKRPN